MREVLTPYECRCERVRNLRNLFCILSLIFLKYIFAVPKTKSEAMLPLFSTSVTSVFLLLALNNAPVVQCSIYLALYFAIAIVMALLSCTFEFRPEHHIV